MDGVLRQAPFELWGSPVRRNVTRMMQAMQARRAAEGERGAVLLEFALVVVLLMVLTFGIVEFSLAWNVKTEAQAAVRAGGRGASAMSKDDNLAKNAALAVESVLQSIPDTEPQYVLIYQVKPGESGDRTTCSGASNCVRYNWTGGTLNISNPVGSWPASQQNSCGTDLDQVGVYVNVKHPFAVLPGLVPGMANEVTLDPHSVFRLEPSPSASCA
jgi:Flp pilus assembly protein TadG